MKKLNLDLLDKDQQAAITALYESDGLLVYGNMGSGKTIISLVALNELLRDGELTRVLIFAPLKVCNTVWKQESEKWAGLDHIHIGVATGELEKRREVVEDKQYNIIVLNFENIPWFFSLYKKEHGFDGLLVDELTKMKAVGGQQFKKLRPRLKDFKWRSGLTGTPVSENFESLFAMIMIIDKGERLGTRKDRFLQEYFYPIDFDQRQWELKSDRDAARLTGVVADVVYTLPDYRHTLPSLTIEHVAVELPVKAREAYNAMAKVSIYGGVVAESAAVQQMKLLQIASGFLYRENESAIVLHNEKIKKCVELLKSSEGNVVIVYSFVEDLKRLRQALPDAIGINDNADVVHDWQAGKIKYLLLHALSGGHGIQLEQGGHELIFITPLWSNDLTEQTIARVWRKGQQRAVKVSVLESTNTVDQLVIERVKGKKVFDGLFTQHLELLKSTP